MDSQKKAMFVAKMGKKTLRFAKGGKVPRQKFGIGGIISGLMGGSGGSSVAIPSGTNAGQLDSSYNTNQAALGNQQNLLTTLQPQAASAVGNQNTIANQYANQAAGNGPNVATSALNQTTGQNVANQAALMAGQRGASANPGLMARQAAQQGANTQQQAAGQAATLQAQQQIAAEGAGAQLASNQIAQTQGATTANTQADQGEQNILQQANTANNQIQGQLAQQSSSQGASALSGLAGGAASILSGGMLAHGGEVSESNPAHPAHGHKKLEFIHKMAKMGMEHFDAGGLAVPQVSYQAQPGYQAPQVQVSQMPAMASNNNDDLQNNFDRLGEATTSGIGKLANGAPKTQMVAGPDNGDAMSNMAAHGGMMGRNHVANFLAGGGKVPAMVSPGEVYLSPDKVEAVVNGGANPLAIGEKIPGKAKVKGDSYKNDIVAKTLDAGGVVVDRKNVKDPKKAQKFVQRSIAKKKVGGK